MNLLAESEEYNTAIAGLNQNLRATDSKVQVLENISKKLDLQLDELIDVKNEYEPQVLSGKDEIEQMMKDLL